MLLINKERNSPSEDFKDITTAIGFLNHHFHNYFKIEYLSDLSLLDELLWALSKIDGSEIDYRIFPMKKLSFAGKGKERWDYLRSYKRFLDGCRERGRISEEVHMYT